VLELKAATLAKNHDQPWLDLCLGCLDLLSSWLMSSRQIQTVRETIPAAAGVDSAGRVA
jgi:hypothetical protein